MSVIDDYLQQVNEPQRTELERIRTIVHALLPDAEEVITYGMPGFHYQHKYLVAFCAFKDHLSLFPTNGPIEKFQAQLTDYKCSKGTIQFTLDHPLPESLIKELVLERAATIRATKR